MEVRGWVRGDGDCFSGFGMADGFGGAFFAEKDAEVAQDDALVFLERGGDFVDEETEDLLGFGVRAAEGRREGAGELGLVQGVVFSRM